MTKCANSGIGSRCNEEMTACVPECTTSADCENNEICINTNCQNTYSEIKCIGDNTVKKTPNLYINKDVKVIGEAYLKFGNKIITSEEMKSVKNLSWYGLLKASAGYPFKDICFDNNTVIEMICDDFWKKNELASLLSNVPNTFPNNGGSLIIPRAYSCAESENCINGKCQTPISNIQIQPITINPNLMGVIKKT